MKAIDSHVIKILEEAERELAVEQKALAAAQKFGGSLRISPDGVFVGSKAGKQAVQDLKRAFQRNQRTKPAKAC